MRLQPLHQGLKAGPVVPQHDMVDRQAGKEAAGGVELPLIGGIEADDDPVQVFDLR